MGQRIVQVDAFTSRPFSGNPAAVCLLAAPQDGQWMQAVAREMNLSETAFLVRRDGAFDLRWFTPTIEVALCGHATLASAHMLWEEGHLEPGEQARFDTKSGRLTADRRGDWIELDFPAMPPRPAAAPAGLEAALGVAARSVWRSRFDYLVELESEEAVRAVSPNFGALRAVETRGVMVTARSSSPQFDFVSRFFGPGAGIDEDPVTGSSHSALAPYWQSRLGKDELRAYQASARGGELRLTVRGDRVGIAGQAVTVLRGELAH